MRDTTVLICTRLRELATNADGSKTYRIYDNNEMAYRRPKSKIMETVAAFRCPECHESMACPGGPISLTADDELDVTCGLSEDCNHEFSVTQSDMK